MKAWVPIARLFWAALAALGCALGSGCSGCSGEGARGAGEGRGWVTEAREGSLALILPPGAQPRKLAGGLRLAEGPAWRPGDDGQGEGELLVSDVVAGRLLRWSASTGLQPLFDGLPAPNGNAVGPGGGIWTCFQGGRAVVLWEPAPIGAAAAQAAPEPLRRIERSLEEPVDERPGAFPRLHSPNDLVVDGRGGLWVTDPPYGLWYGDGEAERATNDVLYVAADADHARSVIRDLGLPNGIALAPDGRTLYVGDAEDGRLWAYPVAGEGRLGAGRLFARFAEEPLDGVLCDERGHVYACVGDGVQVLRANGEVLGTLGVGETTRAGAFGGADGRTLFLTAGGSLYAVRTLVRAAAQGGGETGLK